jgi:hypothetical protein
MKNPRTLLINCLALAILFTTAFLGRATDAQLYFAADKNGNEKVTSIQEGDSIWICVYDPDEDIDCDDRDKIWTDVKVIDAKTGAHIVWKSYKDKDGDANGKKHENDEYVPYKGHFPGPTAGWTGADFLEETNASTGLFVSSRPFQIGTRVAYSDNGIDSAHIVGPYTNGTAGVSPTDFEWGGYLYADSMDDGSGDDRVWVDAKEKFVGATSPGQETPPGLAYLPGDASGTNNVDYVLGRFSNMDTVVGLYVDQDDPSDVALAQAKIIDTRSSISWDQEIYKDALSAAAITVTDLDENLSCSNVEYVPVFIIVNPGSWNPKNPNSANDFCSLKRYGGVKNIGGDPLNKPLEWYSIYNSKLTTADVDLAADGSNQPNVDGTYYIDYPTANDDNVISFATASDSGITRVMFYAQETGADTGIFQLSINNILRDLGFKELNVRDVLVAYYVDPNDQDDVSIAQAYIEERKHSVTSFTNERREPMSEFWISGNPVYLKVVDSNANVDSCCPEKVVVKVCDPHEVDDVEWLVLDELSSNSSVFFSNTGMALDPVWDALGVGLAGSNGGYQLQMDNWRLEAFNEDMVYARYNDVSYTEEAMAQLGDVDTTTAFPPHIRSVRVGNDVSFATMHIGDNQVVKSDGQVTMYFLDRNGNRINQYANSDCVFVEVIDPDQDEDAYRRERINAYWDGAQNLPFAPWDYEDNHEGICAYSNSDVHPVNDLLGDTNIFQEGKWPKLYVLNPRNGRWAAFDLLETGVNTGDFVSVTCIEIASQYACATNLGVQPGDTLLASYQDPSNHSDYAWISIKVSVGGTPIAQGSITSFVDAEGNEVDAYPIGDPIFVKVFDQSLSGAGVLPGALTIDDQTYDLQPMPGEKAGTFITEPISIDCNVGDIITATYVDLTDPNDTSAATATIVGKTLVVEGFYAGPNPFSNSVTFSYNGEGMATSFTVRVYDLSGHCVWEAQKENTLSIVWGGYNKDGQKLANGGYIYVVTATDGDNTFTGKETVFINR